MPAMVRRIKPGWAIGLPALGAVIAFIVLAGTCDRTYSDSGVTFKYPARARITVQHEAILCEQGVYCPAVGADPADVNAMFDRIAETVRIKESGNQ